MSSLRPAGLLAGIPVLPLLGEGVAAPSVGYPLLGAALVGVTCKGIKTPTFLYD